MSSKEQISYKNLPETITGKLKDHFRILENEGVTYLTHGIKRKNTRTCFFSHDHWGSLFIENQIYKQDPFTLTAETTENPYIFWEDVEMDDEGKSVCSWRKEICNISRGLTFSRHAYDFHEILAIGTRSQLFDTRSLALNKDLNQTLCALLKPIRHAHFSHRYKEGVY